MKPLVRFMAIRLIGFVLTVLVALTALFGLLHAAPGGAEAGLAPAVAADPTTRDAVLAANGLDRPLVAQYVDHLGRLARGDLGRSLADGSSVRDAIATAAPVSFELGVLASMVAVVPGAALGVLAARRHGSRVDAGVRVATLAAISVPSYWLAVLGLVTVGERWPQLVPRTGGFVSFRDDPGANLQAILLPALVLGIGALAIVARTTRTALVEVLGGDDVRFARAMGMSDHHVLTRVAARNAAPAGVTVVGLVVAGLLSGTVLVENVFQLPGLGQLMVNAFSRQDFPLALATASLTAVVFLGLNLVADLALYLIDPRRGRA